MADPSAREKITPVILCGGAGTRLWPLSRIDRLKPMVNLTGAGTLLQLTARRVADQARFAAPILVAGMDEADAIEGQLQETGVASGLLLLEPVARGTAAAIALAALALEPEAVMLVMPSDHLIGDENAFRDAVAAALPLARDGWLVTFGIAADRPETGYGYIKRGPAIGERAFEVARFREKPDAGTAAAWLAEGGHDWNAGIFLLRVDAYLAALEAAAPAIAAAARTAAASETREAGRAMPDAEALAGAPAESIDRAVMEKAGKVAVVPVAMGWSDVGSWEAVHGIGPADADDNVVSGDAIALDSRGCLVRSDGPVVVALGVDDLVVVATERAVLVVPRGQTQRVKEAIDALEARRRDQE
jgi:mannose-1-phosphate guanylyltransferase/mannose-1-phosphate guanylyltransferase/mannose-6-phosphate isomerase